MAKRRRIDKTMAIRTINDIQNITQKIKDWAMQTPLKARGVSGRMSNLFSTSGTCRVALATHSVVVMNKERIRLRRSKSNK